ncbi:MAG: helical backbone metal receptor [Methanomassiliicoccales archaeon]
MNKNYVKATYTIVIAAIVILAFAGGYYLAKSSTPETPVYEGANRIVSLSAACTEIIVALGAGDKLVGVDQDSINYANAGNESFENAPGELEEYPSVVSNKTNVGKASNPSMETIVSLNPDIVFAWWYNTEVNKKIGDLGIPVITVNPQSVENVTILVRTIGSLVGKAAEAEDVIAEMNERIQAVVDKVSALSDDEKPLVYYELGTPLKTVGPGTFTHELITMAGGINIAANESARYPLLSNEYILEKNPDIIVIVSYGASIEAVKSRSGWATISAVQNDEVYKIESGWLTASPRLVLGLEQLAKWFHPGLFD